MFKKILYLLFVFLPAISFEVAGQFYYDQLPCKPEDRRIIERTKFYYSLRKEVPISGDTLIIHPSHYCDFKSGDLISREEFNDNGLVIQKEGYFTCPLYDTTRFEYDEKGRLTKIFEKIDKYSIAYYDNKNLVYIEVRSDTSLYFIRVKAFDTKGRLKSVREYFDKDTLKKPDETHLYSFSKGGGKKVKQKFDVGWAEGVIIYHYNKPKGLLIRENSPSFDSTGHRYFKFYTYNDNNLILEEAQFLKKRFGRKRKLVEKTNYFYNTDDKLQKEVYTKYLSPEVEKTMAKEYFYRPDGLVDYEIYTDKNGEPTSKYQYQYNLR